MIWKTDYIINSVVDVFNLLMKTLKLGCLQTTDMKYILVIAAAAFAVVSSNPVPPCLSPTDIVSSCLNESGLNMSDYTNYQQAGSFDPEIIQEQCSKFPEYKQVFQCISTEFNRCSITQIDLPSEDQLSQSMNLLCNDSNIKYECFSLIQQENAKIQSCIMAQFRNINPNTLIKQLICDMSKLSIQCVEDLVAKCDAHTASVVAEMSKLTVSSSCEEKVPVRIIDILK